MRFSAINHQKLPGPVIVGCVVALVFLPSAWSGFTGWDDFNSIVANQRLNHPSLESAAWYFTHGDPGLLIPVTYCLWMSLAAISHAIGTPADGGLYPALFHLLNIFVHAGAAGLVFKILLELTGHAPASACGALLFALHPLQVESVAWVSGARDVVAGMLGLAAILSYLRATRAERFRYFDLWRPAVLLIFATLAKPSAIVVPLILLAIDSSLLRGIPIKRKMVSFALLMLCLTPLIVIARFMQDTAALPPTPLATRPLIAADALSFYIRKLIVPIGLTINYGRTPASVLADPARHVAWILPAVLSIAALSLRRRAPQVVCGVLIFVAGGLPVLGLTPFMFQIHSTVADHYLYLSMLGPGLITASLMSRANHTGVYAIFAVIFVSLIGLSIRQQRFWHDSVTLFTRATEITPQNVSARTNLGNALAQAGQVEQAALEFQKAIEIQPRDHLAHRLLAQALLQQQRYEPAIQNAQRALELFAPGDSPLIDHLILAMCFRRLGQFDQAVSHLDAVLREQPGNGMAAHELQSARDHSLAP